MLKIPITSITNIKGEIIIPIIIIDNENFLKRHITICAIKIFADIVNVLLFGGKPEVEENELVNTTVHSQYKADDGKVHEQERDIAKYWKRGGTDIVLYGIENQTKVEKRMPARISGYEGA